MGDISRERDGVPIAGPMADYVNKAIADAISANLHRMNTLGIVDINGDKERVITAKRQAIAEWNAMQGGKSK